MPEIKRIARGWVRVGDENLVNLDNKTDIYVDPPNMPLWGQIPDERQCWRLVLDKTSFSLNDEAEARALLEEIVRLLK